MKSVDSRAMSDQAASVEPNRNGGEAKDRTELLEELEKQKEEILRLRDLLIAKDAELGTAKGRLAELSEHSSRLIVAAQRLQSRIPRFVWRAGAGARRLGGRRG